MPFEGSVEQRLQMAKFCLPIAKMDGTSLQNVNKPLAEVARQPRILRPAWHRRPGRLFTSSQHSVYDQAMYCCDNGAPPPIGGATVSWVQRMRWGYRVARGHPAARLAHAIVLAGDGKQEHAFRQFARAARRGLPGAQFRLGRCYLLGLGIAPCPDAAIRWLSQAAESSDVEAQTLLTSLALQGISWHAEAGLFEAAWHHADWPPDYQAAMKWGARAARAGSAEAQALLGYVLTS